jgi:hypothetical protein
MSVPWLRHKLAVCLMCRRTLALANPDRQPVIRDIARAQLRLVQEGFVRVRLARHLARFTRGEKHPFTAEDHSRIFDAIHEARESAETWQRQLARLRASRATRPHHRKELA